MKDKLDKLYHFLAENREFNKRLQERNYHSIITPYKTVPKKVVSLLYHIANTQSQPKIDKLSEFFKKIHQNIDCLYSFNGFLRLLQNTNENKYQGLFEGMTRQSGWGPKTAALFTKSIYHIHNPDYSKELRIWNDVPLEITPEDNFYLPVDSVITPIFEHLDASGKKWYFDKINKILRDYDYKGQQIELWDDLWFWGFITQKVIDGKRKFEWNENKYWALEETDKNEETIKNIKSKASEFLGIIIN